MNKNTATMCECPECGDVWDVFIGEMNTSGKSPIYCHECGSVVVQKFIDGKEVKYFLTIEDEEKIEHRIGNNYWDDELYEW